MNYMK